MLDPNYASAYAALGAAYWQRYEITKEREWIDAAQENCRKALTLNGKLAAAYACLTMLA